VTAWSRRARDGAIVVRACGCGREWALGFCCFRWLVVLGLCGWVFRCGVWGLVVGGFNRRVCVCGVRGLVWVVCGQGTVVVQSFGVGVFWVVLGWLVGMGFFSVGVGGLGWFGTLVCRGGLPKFSRLGKWCVLFLGWGSRVVGRVKVSDCVGCGV